MVVGGSRRGEEGLGLLCDVTIICLGKHQVMHVPYEYE